MKDIKGKKIIVTGGAGFIGSNLVEDLCRNNKIYVIDNMHTGSPTNLKHAMKSGNVKLINGDVKSISKYKIKADTVFHLGMYSSSPMYKKNPMLLAEVVAGMINVLEYSREQGSQVVFASTSSIYNGVKPPQSEGIVPKVTDYYTEGRVFCERISELYNKMYGTNIAAMRFFSVYGKHEEAKKSYANLVTQFIWEMKKGRSPVIYGDGRQKRDLVYVSDVVDALKKAASVRGFEILNVGTGKNCSLNELVGKINKELGTSIKPRYVKMPMKNYVMETKADTRKAKRVLGFRAKISLERGISLLV